ncbi:DUF4892 domain-containing protein [Pseudomonas saudiphocaensis]|uniref:DUF4892 domain-containing protein n=1 Tax=Pseudomonas saudiphocaensis TaxID=1499686 RepID=UPI00269F083C
MTDLHRAAVVRESRLFRAMGMLGLTLFASVAGAVELSTVANIDVMSSYPQAQVVSSREQPALERTYPMDGIRRISGRVRTSNPIIATGQLSAVTYQLPETHTGIEAFDNARNQLIEAGAELLFWCEGRECGSSSLWANDIFQRARLYGPEAQQAYLLARQADDSGNLVALYGITRGNGRPYLHVEQFSPAQPLGVILPNPATLLRQLKNAGTLWFPRLADEPSQEWAALLANVLRLDSTIRVALEGEGAAAWHEALLAERISARRLEGDTSAEKGLRIRLLR